MYRTIRHLSFLMLTLLLSLFISVANAQTLHEVVVQALKVSPDLNFDIANRFAVGEELNQAKAGFLPRVDLRAGIGREKTLNPTASAITGIRQWNTFYRREANVEITQNLFDGFGTLSEVTRQRGHLHSAAHKIVGQAQDVALDVIERYLDVIRYQHRFQEAKANLREHERIYSMIKDRSESGLTREADVEQATGRLARARSNVVAERGNLSDARTAFIRVVGSEPQKLKWPHSPGTKDLPKSLAQALRMAHKNHPTLKSITNDVAAAEAQHRAAKSFFYPRVDLVAFASRGRNLDGIPGSNNDQAVMVRGTYTIFQGGSIAARARETAYRIQEANEERNRTITQLDEHVRLAWNGLRTTSSRLINIRRHREASKATVGAYAEQFKLNKRSLLDLLDGQAEYYNTTLEYYDDVHDEVYDRYRILNSIGCLLQYLHIPVPAEATVPEPYMFDFL